jgi:uridine kinase
MKHIGFSCGGLIPSNAKLLPKAEGIEEILKMAANQYDTLKRPIVIGIAGGSGSGKSTFAKELAERFIAARTINIDDYYRSRSTHDFSFDQPEALSLDLLALHLRDLKILKSVRKPIYSFKDNGGERIGCERLSIAPYIIIDGLFALSEHIIQQCDIKVFIETDLQGRFVRRITRDVNRTGQDPADILAYFLNVVEPMHRKYVDSQKAFADIVIQNPYNRLAEPKKTGCIEDCQFKIELINPLSNETLRKAGAEILARTSQEDVYFSVSDGHNDELVRVRREPGDKLIFTYKAPRNNGVRDKFEFPISLDGKNAIEDMFTERLRINKLRDIFILNGIIFSQDEVRFCGKKKRYFIEVRGIQEIVKATSFLRLIGVEGPLSIQKISYAEIAI